MAKKQTLSRAEKRNLRTQQVIFIVISIIIVLAMVGAMVTSF